MLRLVTSSGFVLEATSANSHISGSNNEEHPSAVPWGYEWAPQVAE
jgi:hypothetical protein